MRAASECAPVLMSIGAGVYEPGDWSHHTAGIWEHLAVGFEEHHVVARSSDNRFHRESRGPVTLHLVPRISHSEGSFLFTSAYAIVVGLGLRPTHIRSQSPALGGPAAIALGRLLRRPVMLEFHGMHYFRDDRSSSGWSRRDRTLQRIARNTVRRATRLRSLSPSMSRLILSTYGKELANRIDLIPNRVDTSTFSPGKPLPPAPGGRLRLVTVGAINSNKNQAGLIRDLAACPIQTQLTCIGEGPGLEFAQQAAFDSGLEVRFMGRLRPEEVAAELKRHDVYVHYSRSEALPRAIIEAMSVGLPIVAVDVGFIPDIVASEQGGVLMSEMGADNLDAALQVVCSPSARQKMGRLAREYVMGAFEEAAVYKIHREMLLAMSA